MAVWCLTDKGIAKHVHVGTPRLRGVANGNVVLVVEGIGIICIRAYLLEYLIAWSIGTSHELDDRTLTVSVVHASQLADVILFGWHSAARLEGQG